MNKKIPNEVESAIREHLNQIIRHTPNYFSEIFPVIVGIKPASILEVPKFKLNHYKFILKICNLNYEIIPYNVFNKKRAENNLNPSKSRLKGCYLTYISKDKKSARKTLFFDLKGDN